MTNRSPALSRWKHGTLSVLLLAAIGSFYLWTVWQGHLVPFGTNAGMYPDLTNGFLAGQLSLESEPRPELLALDDPYDPRQNFGLTVHYVSLYKGRDDIYFGVTPVILLFLPFRALGLGNMPESTAVAIFVFGAVLFSLLTLSHIRRRFFPAIRRVPYLSWYLMLGFGGSIPYFLRRPAVYEVAIACGSFCLTAAIYFVMTAVSDEDVSIWRAALGSLCIGLAVGARPHLLLASPLLALIAWKLRAQDRQRPALAPLCALFAPIVLVGLSLGLYNYLRFDSWTEFGHAYQLAGVDIRTLSYNLLRIPVFSYLYLWQPGHVTMGFPYTHVTILNVPVPGHVTVEPVAGVFYTTPVLYVLLFLPVLIRSSGSDTSGRPSRSLIDTAYGWTLILLAISLSQVLFLATFPGATMRYIVDFSLPLMTAASVVMMGVEARLETSPWRAWAKAGFVLLVGLTIFFNASLGITGYYDNLRLNNPEAYKAIKSTTDAAIDAVVPPFLNKDLQLLSIESAGGAPQTVGVPAFWLSGTDSQIEFFAKHDGQLTLHAALAIHPEHTRTGLASVILTARGPAGGVHTFTAGNEETTFVMPVRRGHNTISFRVDYDPTKAAADDPHIMLLRGLDWRLSAPPPVK